MDTLLDNDRVHDDLSDHPARKFGNASRDRYRAIFEALRGELGYTDYPFADRLYAGALDAIAHLREWGPTIILSDGDVVFQPRYPARHYVMADDKLRILAAMKECLHDRLTSVFPRQGHYALDSQNLSAYPPADLAIDRIGDLLDYDFPALLWPASAVGGAQETT